MKKIKVNEMMVDFPTSWDDINLNMYLKLRELETRQSEMELIDYNIAFMSIMLQTTDNNILELTPADFKMLFEELYNLTTSVAPRPDSDVIEIDGQTFVFDKQINKITSGMFIDLDIINKDGDFWAVAHKIASILIRPVEKENKWIIKGKKILGAKIKPSDFKIKKYDASDSMLNADLFYYKLPMPFLIELAGFFLLFEEALPKIMQDFLLKQNKKQPQVERQLS